MTLTLKQAATKALADLQLIPGWEKLEDQLLQFDPFGDRLEMAMAAAEREIQTRTERPYKFMEAEVSEAGEHNPVMVRVLLFILSDLRVPAAIWPRQEGARTYNELVVY